MQVYSSHVNQEQTIKNKGVLPAYLIGAVGSNILGRVPGTVIAPKMFKILGDKNTAPLMNDAFQKAFDSTKIANKGVGIELIDDFMDVGNYATKSVVANKKGFLGKIISKMPKSVQDGYENVVHKKLSSCAQMVKDGQNAFFDPKLNQILLPKNGNRVAGFHELGHALNKNVGKIGKVLSKARVFAPIASIGILLTSILTKEKANAVDENGNKKKGIRQFIKNHAGALAGISVLPIVLEEGLASLKGNKLAKEFLSKTPDLLKNVKKSNLYGFISYIGLAVGTGIATHLAVKVKDKIQENYEQKLS